MIPIQFIPTGNYTTNDATIVKLNITSESMNTLKLQVAAYENETVFIDWGGPNTSPLIAENETINLTRYVSALFRLQFYSNPYVIPTFEIISGLLPEGLSLDKTTGYISGAPYLYQTVTAAIRLTVNNQGVETSATKDVKFIVANMPEPA